MITEHIDPVSCRRMWAAALHRHLADALRPHCRDGEQRRDKNQSDYLIRTSSDFSALCDLAGVDADRLREMYINGKITYEMVAKAIGAGNGRRPA